MVDQPPHPEEDATGTRRGTGAAMLTLMTLALLVVLAPGSSPAQLRGLAGTGSFGWTGDGGPAAAAALASPSAVAMQAGGGLLVADTDNHRIRRIAPDGTIATIAGAGPCCGAAGGWAGDGLLATDPAVRLHGPRGVAVHPDGRILIADTENHLIRAITPSGGMVRIAGDGTPGFSTDGGPAITARLNRPSGVAVTTDGAILVADTGNHRILRVDPTTTAVSRVAGIDAATVGGYDGDGGPAASARLNAPAAVAVAASGLVIADTGNHRIRHVDGNGTITTLAGNGATGPPVGDGGPATLASIVAPEGVAVVDGTLLIADTGHARVRSVTANGTITTLAGSGIAGDAGDGGPAGNARISMFRGVNSGPRGPVLADTGNHRVREVVADPLPVATPPTSPVPPGVGPLTPMPVAPPVLRRSAVAGPARGRVRIRVPGARRFVRASTAVNVPMGTEVDVTDGQVEVRFVTTRAGRQATATVSGGRFVVRQSAARDGGQHPGVLVLSGPLRHCPKPAGRSGSSARRDDQARPRATKKTMKPASKRQRQRGRRLTVQARGKIKTRGKYGAAIVRGTHWTIVDRCRHERRPGTLVSVRSGRVAVDAFRLRTRTTVRAGRRYLAPASRRR